MSMINVGVSNVLFSKTQQQVLGLLYGFPSENFHTNDIIRQTHAGTGAVQRELIKLTAAGILTMKQIGNQKRYQANPANPFFMELRGLILKTFGLADLLKKAIIPLTEKIICAFIYGSIAKQQDTALSDIDIMFIGEQLTYADLFDRLASAEAQLKRKINPTFYTPHDFARKRETANHFIIQVLKQPKIFLIGTENELNASG